jgi:penicillin-binding protein 2
MGMRLDAALRSAVNDGRIFAGRALVAAVLVVLALALVLGRLAKLQITDHAHFTTLSEENRVKLQPLPPTRGLIYDAKGVMLADNFASYSLDLTLEKVKDRSATIAELRTLVPIEDKDIRRFDRLRAQGRRFDPVPLRLNLNEEEVARISVNAHRFPGVGIGVQLLRYYPLGVYTAHVLGYVGRISEREVEQLDPAAYSGTNYIGKGGVEKAYEDVLRGQVGYQQVEVNAKGRVLRVLEGQSPRSGRDLHLHLDIALQQAATAALGKFRGSVVAIDPRNGGVLAMVSNPGFDPNPFVEGIGAEEYAALRDDPDHPLFNRAVRGQYPPGSTAKPFVALGGLATGTITYGRSKFCPGAYQLPGSSHRYRDWRKGGHGTVSMEQAIVQSCDVYFYDLAHDMGIDRFHDFLAHFRFGAKTGVDVSGELPGLLPSREWAQRTRKQPWFAGETLIVGIGQGSFLATPMQLAVATAAMANRGRLITPRVVRATSAPGAGPEEPLPLAVTQVPVPDKHQWRDVIEAMTQVVERGTAKRIRTPAYKIAGKTGTAQVFTVGQKESYRESQVPERMRDHALFVAFAPVDDPRIAVAVIVENGGHGGSVAAPIARKVMDAYLGQAPAELDAAEAEDGD